MLMALVMAMMRFPQTTKVRVAIFGCAPFCSCCKKELSVPASSTMMNDDDDGRGRIS